MIGELEIIVGTEESVPVANLDHDEWDAFEVRARETIEALCEAAEKGRAT